MAAGYSFYMAPSPTVPEPIQPQLPAAPVRPCRERSVCERLPFWLIVSAMLLAVGIFYHHYWRGLNNRSHEDNAIALLQGLDLARGNLLLRHWAVPPDNLLTIDLPWYALAVKLAGLSPWLMQAVPLALLLLLLALAARLLRKESTTLAYAREYSGELPSYIGLIVIFSLLAIIAPGRGDPWLLEGPNHVGTTIYSLLTLLMLSTAAEAGGHRKRSLLAACALALTLIISFGDPMALLLIAVPALVVWCGDALLGRAGKYSTISTLLVLAACLAGGFLRGSFVELGGFSVLWNLAPSFIHLADLRAAIAQAATNWLGLAGCNFTTATWPAAGAAVLRAVAAALVLLLAGGECWRWLRGERLALLDRWLAVGTLVVFVAAMVSEQGFAKRSLESHYQLPGYILGVALLARKAAEAAAWSPRMKKSMLLGSMLLLVSCGPVLAQWRIWPHHGVSTAKLARWLDRHHFHRGFGCYWDSNMITVQTGGKVTVRALACTDKARPYHWLSKSTWYNTRKHHFNFYVFDRYGAQWFPLCGTGRIKYSPDYLPQGVIATFGKPGRIYHYLHYTIAIWPHALHF